MKNAEVKSPEELALICARDASGALDGTHRYEKLISRYLKPLTNELNKEKRENEWLRKILKSIPQKLDALYDEEFNERKGPYSKPMLTEDARYCDGIAKACGCTEDIIKGVVGEEEMKKEETKIGDFFYPFVVEEDEDQELYFLRSRRYPDGSYTITMHIDTEDGAAEIFLDRKEEINAIISTLEYLRDESFPN